ncbi:hypothetical protein CVT25_014326 [Psilocybe cyanescens]|uniref:Uncharacterized protein n=1 Tax=Psilocybe cyanescens TaxID=93625 RepID=A0A409XL09_PSICY|nr:hypothetical protein CVT25_014326 [Psilocybe cyanescens]
MSDTSYLSRSTYLRRTKSSSSVVVPSPSGGSDENNDVDRPSSTTCQSSPESPHNALEILRFKTDPWSNETTPTQASVSAFFAARRKESLLHNEDTSSCGSRSPDCLSPSAEEAALACPIQDPKDGTEQDGEVIWSTDDGDSMALCPPNALQNSVFIYPSSMNANNTRYVWQDPAIGLVFSSKILPSGKRRYDFFYRASDKPLYSYKALPTLLAHMCGWVSIVASWRVPLSLRVQCGKDASGRDECMERILDILFHPSLPFIWRDVELDLNNSVAEHFLYTQEQRKRAVGLVRVRLETTNCSTDAASRLLTRIQKLPNIKEVRYGYELDERRSLHFKRGRFFLNPLWSKLNIIDVAGEMGEADCILFLKQCVRASNITLRSLVNRDDNFDIVRHQYLALKYRALSVHPPSVRHLEANSGKAPGPAYTTLPMLKVLKLVPSQFDTVIVLKHFTFPRLERLGFDTILSADSDTVDDIQELLIRSQAPLLDLDIYDMYLGPSTVARLLRAVFVGTLSRPRSPLEDSTASDVGSDPNSCFRVRSPRRAVRNLSIHFLSVFKEKIKRTKIPHEAEYRRHWNKKLAAVMMSMSADDRRGVVIPDLYIAASQYGQLRMNVGWGARNVV